MFNVVFWVHEKNEKTDKHWTVFRPHSPTSLLVEGSLCTTTTENHGTRFKFDYQVYYRHAHIQT